MAYEDSSVPVGRSQEAIRALIMKHSGFGIAFVSDADPFGRKGRFEGFHAKVLIDKKPYTIRIMAKVKPAPAHKTQIQRAKFTEQEERRIWRVIYYHLKSVYEAADSGVMEFRELMLPYLVTSGGATIAEKLLPQIDMALSSNLQLTDGGKDQEYV